MSGRPRPGRRSIPRYDYGNLCNYEGCQEEQMICDLCLELDDEVRYGHLHYWVLPISIDVYHDRCLIQDVIIHTHFAFRRGTIAPAFAEARNLHCIIHQHWEKLSEWCNGTWKVKPHKGKPYWLHDEWGFYWLFGPF